MEVRESIQVVKIIDIISRVGAFETLAVSCNAPNMPKNQVLNIRFPLSAKAKKVPIPFNVHVIADTHGIHFHEFVTLQNV